MDCVDFPRVLPNSPRKSRGQIQVIFGPMFSGKSTELMRRVRRFQIAQYNCLVVKYAKDTRYSDSGMATHDKNTMAAVPANCLGDVRSLALQACVIGIDEGQFFPDTVEFCEEMANLGKTVIVAALDGTFQRKPFGNILHLVPLAESVVKLHAVCMQCYKEAAYTKRIGTEKEVEVIGGADKYQAVCRKCYRGLVDDKENSIFFRKETPQQALAGKPVDPSFPRKLFSSINI
ncbi:thymidine kinase, cytosolic [Melanotaenia boesemani]|uniref:thymidine kinase, cytosolic n=1 Tax=Melanotaenia boesemani TaxID=1250792 RepID=UPI001C04F8E6|nr:thymidine kinase, cytosolic [Melanotaenia boesemani]XP_041839875.1 thymidine kinase, cytosolic [Melanotaenia boesemani]